MQNIGTFKWVKNKNNAPPIKLKTQIIEKDITQVITKKEIKKNISTKISFKKTVIKTGATILKKYPIVFSSKLISPTTIKIANKFIYRDNAKANITYTDKAHGFISSSVIAIAEDNNHNMWFACDNGLVKFDGVRYYLYDIESGLPSISFQSILFDKRTNKLWINTAEGFYYIENNSCYIPKTNAFDIKEFQGYYHITKDNHGNIWFTSKNKGVLCYYNNLTFSLLNKSSGLPTNSVGDIKFDEKNNIYLACGENGLFVIKPKEIINYLAIGINKHDAGPLSLCIKKDTVFIGTWHVGLIKITPNDSTLFSLGDRLTWERIFNIVESKTGIYYTIFGRGTMHLSGNKKEFYNERNGLVNIHAYALLIDSYDNIWISDLERGISRMNENVFRKSQHFFSEIAISNIKYSANKKFKWYCLGHALPVTQETDSSYIGLTVDYDSTDTQLKYINDAVVSNNNELWCATYLSGICNITAKKAYFYKYSTIENAHNLFSTALASDNKIWFNTEMFGLIYYDFTSKLFYRKYKKNGALSDRCNVLYKQTDGSIISTYDYGMQKIKNTTLYDFCINGLVYKKTINFIYKTQSGKVLVATSKDGLFLLEGETVYSLNMSSGLASNNVISIREDENHKIWLTTSNGIERVIFNNHSVTFDRFFDTNYGLFMNEMYGCTFKNEQGKTCISTINGVFEFEPKNELAKIPNPIININAVLLNNKLLNNLAYTKIVSNDNLQINYNIINWGHENEYTHYWLLVSENNDTTSFVIGEHGNITVTDLIANKYKLFIMMKQHHHNYYSIPLLFTITPYWYSTWWFRALLLILLVSYFYYLYLQKRNENKRLTKKVEEQTANLLNEKIELEKSNLIILKQNSQKDTLIQEVHHRVKNNLQFITAMFEMQINSTNNKSNKVVLGEAFHRVNAITLVHEMLYNKDDLEYVPVKDYLNELVVKLIEVVFDKKIPTQFNLDIEDVKFDINYCVAIGMITSEIINNAIKHAFIGNLNPTITITLSYNTNEQMITYIIKDNGIGLNKDHKTTGLGMRLIDIFSRQIDMSYELKNENGLTYLFKIPFAANEK